MEEMRWQACGGREVRGSAGQDTRKLFSELLRDESFLGYVTQKVAEEAIASGESWADRGKVEHPFPGLMDVAARSSLRGRSSGSTSTNGP